MHMTELILYHPQHLRTPHFLTQVVSSDVATSVVNEKHIAMHRIPVAPVGYTLTHVKTKGVNKSNSLFISVKTNKNYWVSVNLLSRISRSLNTVLCILGTTAQQNPLISTLSIPLINIFSSAYLSSNVNVRNSPHHGPKYIYSLQTPHSHRCCLQGESTAPSAFSYRGAQLVCTASTSHRDALWSLTFPQE